MSVIIETSIGDITVDLYTDERPKCCMNFLKLCKIKYYNFSLFHTVQQNLVAQTGDPTASGRGGESIFVKLYGEHSRFFEMEVSPRIKHSKKGLISMVNNGSDMHGSQFFLTLADNLDYLDGKHTVFGELAEGFDIIDKLNNAYCDESNRPIKDIRIYHTIILHDPYDDPDGLIIPSVSPFPTEEMLNSEHIACDADINEDKTEEELAEMMAEKEAKANTQILEMVGDLPDADVAPPDNVLFVCKLNPVTTAEDLEVIFSRFGPIVSCDVIKDSKTGESLQYAFIEFENPQHCENAYFKMDNVLIDDRRIHVDFSQSVSKFMWKRKGKVVEIIPTGDTPVYVLKNQHRSNDQYDLVYDHDDVRAHKEYKTGSKKRKNLADDAISQHRWKNSQSPVHNIISEHESRDGASLKGKRSRSSDTDGAVKNTRELEFQSKKSGSHTERHNVEKDIGRRRHVEHFQQIEVTKERSGRKRSRERNYDTLKKRPPQRSSNNEGREDTKYCKTGHYPDTDSDNNQADKPSKDKKKKKKHHKHKKHSYSSD